MIHIDRRRVAAPAVLTSELAAEEYAAAEAIFANAGNEDGYVRLAVSLYKDRAVRRALTKLFREKCAFCERKLDFMTDANIEHFRPKANCVDHAGGHFPQHYWWLANAWDNLYLACRGCIDAKSNRFPIAGERATIGAKGEDLDAEIPLLLDPCRDQPQEHLHFAQDGFVAGTTERGRATVELFSLNRKKRVDARAIAAKFVRDSLADGKNPGKLNDVDSEFSGLRLQLIEEWQSQHHRETALGRKRQKDVERGLGFEELSSESPGEGARGVGKLGREKSDIIRSGRASRDLPLGGPRRRVTTRSAEPPSLDAAAFDLPAGAKEAAQERISQVGRMIDSLGTFSLAESGDDEIAAGRYYFQSRQIDYILLRDFKALENLELHCGPSGSDRAGWTMLLGENGTGKSSVLEAVALALAGHSYRGELLRRIDASKTPEVNAADLIRRPRSGSAPDRAEVMVRLTDQSEARLVIDRSGAITANQAANDARVLLLGYGATRLLPRGEVETRGTAYARADNLFDPFVPLGDARRWLLDLTAPEFDHLVPAFAQLLGLRPGEMVTQNNDTQRIDVHLFDSRVPLEQLSAGYQTVVALVADIMSILRQRWKGSMGVAEGVVLLDEISAHLHPKWRMRLVSSLRNTFPRVQFIATTHDPLSLRGLSAGEVIVMRRQSSGRVGTITDLPSVAGLQVDQLLTSEHFGLQSTVDPELEQDFETYYELLLRQNQNENLSEAEAAHLAELKERLAARRLLGETRRERLMLEAIDRNLAQERELSTSRREEARGSLEKQLDDLLAAMEL